MIVCRQCGQAADGSSDFCTSCGAFLEWEGEALAEQPAPPGTPGPTPAPPAAPGGWPGTDLPAPPPGQPATPVTPAPPPEQVPAGGGTAGGQDGPGTVICLECGARNEGDRRFCRRCGSTLDLVALSGRGVPTEPVWSPPADAHDPGARPGADPAPPADPTFGHLGGTAEGGLVARPPSAPVPAPPSRVGARPPAAPTAPAVPPTPATTPARGLQPSESKVRPAPVRPARVEAEVAPGGPDCPECGTANPPGRRFCRRCGADLPAVVADADPPELAAPTESWWRRLLRRRRPTGDDRSDGAARPSRSARAAYRRSLDVRYRVLRVLAVVAGLGVMAGALGVAGLNPISGARDLWDRYFPRDERIGELQASLDPELALEGDFGPGAAVDGDPSTAWATSWQLDADASAAEGCVAPEDATGSGEDGAAGTGGGAASLVIALPEAGEVSKIAVQPGLAAGDPTRASHLQPTLLELRFDDGTCAQMELADEAGFQEHRLDRPETGSVRISVLDAAPPRDPAASRGLVAIGEVRLFTPR